MKKTAVLVCILAFMLCSCGKDDAATATLQSGATSSQNSAKQQGPVFRSLSPLETQQLIQTRKDLLLIDVRNQDELVQGAIEGSQLLPFWYIAKNNHKIPTGRPLLLICAVGGRSYAAGQILVRQGYNEIYNLSGGIDAWKKAGLPLKY